MEHAPDLTDPYLRNWFADVRSVTVGARQLFEELAAEQLVWKPSAKSWSVAECLAHLARTGELYHPGVRSALSGLRAEEAGDSPFRARWFQRLFISSVGPQSRRRLKTFKAFEPATAQLDPAQVERDFFARQEELADLIRDADGCDLNQGKVFSPITKLLSFTLGEVLWLLTAHGQRHLLQAQRVTQAVGFPGSSGP